MVYVRATYPPWCMCRATYTPGVYAPPVHPGYMYTLYTPGYTSNLRVSPAMVHGSTVREVLPR